VATTALGCLEILQAMGINAPIAVGTEPVRGHTFIHVDGNQSADISNDQDSGDKFSAFLALCRRSVSQG